MQGSKVGFSRVDADLPIPLLRDLKLHHRRSCLRIRTAQVVRGQPRDALGKNSSTDIAIALLGPLERRVRGTVDVQGADPARRIGLVSTGLDA